MLHSEKLGLLVVPASQKWSIFFLPKLFELSLFWAWAEQSFGKVNLDSSESATSW